MRTASSLGGGGMGWAKTFTTSVSCSRRPASMHRLPLSITWRDFNSCWICDQERSGSHSRSAAATVLSNCRGSTLKI